MTQQIKRAYAGPMWSGKTWSLCQSLHGRVLAVDWRENTRNSGRDLFSAVGSYPVERVYIGDDFHGDYDFVLIDEAHFADAFSKQREFFCAVAYALDHATEIRIAGLRHDCYRNQKEFEVWSLLRGLQFDVRDILPRVPCAQCGSVLAIYSCPTGTGRVGNDYVNICPDCWRNRSADAS